MSFNRLQYDKGTYTRDLNESVKPGFYRINQPLTRCEPCHPHTPHVRLQSKGNSLYRDGTLVDVNSELLGLNRKLSNNPKAKYMPSKVGCSGSGNKHFCGYDGKQASENCHKEDEHTRLSNPPCTLRGTGWNRWEWLCLNPQSNVEIPFDCYIDNRTVVKDNHRPFVPVPMTEMTLPSGSGDVPCEPLNIDFCAVPTHGR